jgi:transketolase
MAIAESHLAARYNRPGYEIINHFTFGIVSDGDLMEGVASEAASLAGHLRLGKLIYLYDSNRVSLAAGTDITFTENVAERFSAYGWQIQMVEDGNDIDAIDLAIQKAKEDRARPSLIIIRTHIGYGSPQQDSFKAHGEPLGPDNVRKTKRNLQWPEEPDFYIPAEALDHFRELSEMGEEAEVRWNAAMEAYTRECPDLAAELKRSIKSEFPENWDADVPQFPADPKGMATRSASEKILNAIASRLPQLIGGSADLNPSTKTALKNMGDFEFPDSSPGDKQGSSGGGWNYAGRNLHFGVREHGMGAILNGLATHGGTIPYGATFLIFSDYMRPPMRLAALMEVRVVYVFTHDSIGLGQDGPTHQPIGHLAGLRAMPNLIVIRPCDANETAAAWRTALKIQDRPVALILTRQNVPTLDRTELAPAELLSKGAYILTDAPDGKPDLILIASGSEVQLILAARDRLQEKGIRVRTVSMPSWELFERQKPRYKRSVFPNSVRIRLAVEAGSTQGWHKYVGDRGQVIGIDHFGSSAPGPELMRAYGFTVENICECALDLLKVKLKAKRPEL